MTKDWRVRAWRAPSDNVCPPAAAVGDRPALRDHHRAFESTRWDPSDAIICPSPHTHRHFILTRHQNTMRTRLLLQSLIYLSITVLMECMPYWLLTSTRPKCFTVEGPRNTVLKISYQAPDMVLLPEDDSEMVQQQKEGGQQQQQQQGGLDERFNKRYQEKMIAMQRAGRTMVDMSMVVYQKGETASSTREWNLAHGVVGSGRVRRELTERQGTVEFVTGARDAPVELCLQSMAANPKNPSRVALSVTQQVKVGKQQKEEKERQTQKHMSVLALEIEKLDKKADMILTNADYAKEQEVDFHEQSLAMNRASQYWPMIHLGVLLITGFTQANHIIRFFKSRHIY